MSNLSREDIQAIAQELSRIKSAEQPTQTKSQSASTRAQSGAISGKNQQSKTAKPKGARGSRVSPNSLVNIGLLVFWATVFIILLVKLSPYI